VSRNLADIIRRSSTTFSNSTRFFPAAVRRDVTALYAFVRTADDFVDRVSPDAAGFADFRATYESAAPGRVTGDQIIDRFVELQLRKTFDPDWVRAFLDAMAQDLHKTCYATHAETADYTHGSAGVVGEMMARILGLPDESIPYARFLGMAFQYVNFIRDIDEDLGLGRVYIPLEAIRAAGLPELTRAAALANPECFSVLVTSQLKVYFAWRGQAEPGFAFIPRRARAAIRTAADMYDYTADVIGRDPLIVFERKVKPSARKVIARGLRNLVGAR